MGPGHTAYIAEIEALARRGYRVLTLDFAGCGESGGKYLGSLNKPTRDVIDLLNHLNLKEQIILMNSRKDFIRIILLILKEQK